MYCSNNIKLLGNIIIFILDNYFYNFKLINIQELSTIVNSNLFKHISFIYYKGNKIYF